MCVEGNVEERGEITEETRSTGREVKQKRGETTEEIKERTILFHSNKHSSLHEYKKLE